MTRYTRPAQFDRVTNPGGSRADDLGHFVVGPFDETSRAMDLKWGVGRLAEIVSPEDAVIWATTMANLNNAIRECYDPEDEKQALANLKACVESGIRGFAYMDAEAERTGKPKADPRVWEYDLDGVKVGIMADVDAWPAIKAARPDLRLFGLREVAVAVLAIDANRSVAAVKDKFPDAKVTAIRSKPPCDFAGGGDTIPF